MIIWERNLSRLVQCIYKMAQKIFFGSYHIKSNHTKSNHIFEQRNKSGRNLLMGAPILLGLTLRSIWAHKITIENYLVRSIKYFDSTDLCWIFTRLRNHVWMVITFWVYMGFFWHTTKVETGPISYWWCIQFFVKK